MENKNPFNLNLNFNKSVSNPNPLKLDLNFGQDTPSMDVAATFIAVISKPDLTVDALFGNPNDVFVHFVADLAQPCLILDGESYTKPPIKVNFFAEINAPELLIEAMYDFDVQRYTTHDNSVGYDKSKPLLNTVDEQHQIVNQLKGQLKLKHQLTERIDYLNGDQYESVSRIQEHKAQAWQLTNPIELRNSSVHQNNKLYRSSNYHIWQDALRFNLTASDQYDYNLKTRKSSLNWWQQAIQTGITRGFGFNATTWLKLLERLRYQQTKRPKTGRWIPDPEPIRPPFSGTGDLDFCCKCVDVDPLNVVLHFSDDPCCDDGETGHLDNKKVYFVMNEGYLKRVSDNSDIQVKSLNLSIDRDSWCWSFSASLPFTEESKVNTDDEYIEVELGLNGFIWRFLIESNTSNQQFASTDIQVKGRSVTAMLAEEAGTRSYNHNVSASSVQLAQAELERITLATPFALDWSLVDQTGWNVLANAWSYMDLTPVKAIQEIAEGAGGFVSSHMSERKLLIQPRYAYASWEWAGLTPEINVPFNLVLTRAREKDFKPEYNAVTVSAENTGIQAVVKREGTAGDKMAPPVVTPFINSEQPALTMARSELSKYGKKRMYQDTIPLHPDIGVILPSKIIGMQDKDLSIWNGHTYGTAITASWDGQNGLKIRQTFTVERYIE